MILNLSLLFINQVIADNEVEVTLGKDILRYLALVSDHPFQIVFQLVKLADLALKVLQDVVEDFWDGSLPSHAFHRIFVRDKVFRGQVNAFTVAGVDHLLSADVLVVDSDLKEVLDPSGK